MTLDSYNCEICLTGEEETVQHLFWSCPFAQQCWGILNLQMIQAGQTVDNVLAIKGQMNSQFFMIAIILMCWTICKARNKLIFKNNQIGIQDSRRFFFREINMVSLRVKENLAEAFDQWIRNCDCPFITFSLIFFVSFFCLLISNCCFHTHFVCITYLCNFPS